MEFDGDVVSCPVGEEFAEAGLADDFAGGVVGLVAVEEAGGVDALFGEGALDAGDGGVAGFANGGEDLLFEGGGFAADYSGPGDVVEGAVGDVFASPDVDEEEVAVADGQAAFGGGLVVGVGAVGSDADVGSVFPDEVFAAHGFGEPLDEVEFGDVGGVAGGGMEDAA